MEEWREQRRPEAFRAIVRRHSRMVFATCRRVLSNAHDAEEVAQECFLTLAQSTLPPDTSLGAWLHTVATRRSVDRLRTDRRRRVRETRFAQHQNNDAVQVWNAIEPLVDECLERLPARTRSVLIAYYLNQDSQADVAEAFSISQPTVSRILADGIEEVRRLLRQKGVAVPGTTFAVFLSGSADAAVPPSLTAALGKIAIGGAAGNLTTPVIVGGSLMAKKVGAAVAMLCMVLLGLWAFKPELFRPVPKRPTSEYAVTLPADSKDVQPASAVGESAREETSAQADGLSAKVPDRTAGGAVAQEREGHQGTVAGIVVWSTTAEPAPDRSVRLWTEDSDVDVTAKSGRDGRFEFAGIPADAYFVTAVDESVFPERAPVTFNLAENETRDDIELIVSGGGAIEGRITIDNSPAAESEIPIAQLQGGTNYGTLIASTDAEGKYRIDGILEGERQFYAMLQVGERGRLMSNMPRAEIVPGETTHVDFVFPSGTGTLEGLILLNDKLATDREIVITFYDRSGNDVVGQVFLQTDTKGLYAVDGVPYENVVVGAAMMIEPGRPIYPGPGGTIERKLGRDSVIDFEFTATKGRLEGMVTMNGIPAGNQRILVSGHFTNTDEHGYYRVEGIQKGPFQLWAELMHGSGKIYSTHRPTVELAEGEVRTANFDFSVGDGAIEGHVTTEDGRPVPGRIAASFVDAEAETVYFTARINTDGRYRLERLPQTTIDVSLTLENGDPIPLPIAPVQIDSTETVQLDIEIPLAVWPE